MTAAIITPTFKVIDDKISFNLGAGMDVPTGTYTKGMRGENILNGGMPFSIGVVGGPNTFKTTIAKYCLYVVFSMFVKNPNCFGNTYDTENNVLLEREFELCEHIERLNGELNPFSPDALSAKEPRFQVSDKTLYMGNEWFEEFKVWLNGRIQNREKLLIDLPIVDPKTKGPRKILVPFVALLDSLTEFETQDVQDMKNKNELGDSGANTLFMRQGLSKARMVSELATLVPKSGSYMALTAHVGKNIMNDPYAPPKKDLQYLKNGDVIKGVTSKFLFLTQVCWHTLSAPPMMTKDKTPEYPRDQSDDVVGDTDLVCITMTILRNKVGGSGGIVQVIASQEEGVLPSMTEFHLIKTNDRFGFEGNDRNYNLVLLPDVKLSRTTIRRKIDENPKLRRALNILSELCQQINLWVDGDGLFCTPKELYDDLMAIGYDWDTLLNTRYYYLPNQYDPTEKPFLSTKDLLEMRVGKYVPYWWDQKAKPLDMSKCKTPKKPAFVFE